MITQSEIMENIPEKDILLLADALFFSVYGWQPEKVKRLKIDSLHRWIKLAKKRLTWSDCYKMRSLLEPSRKSLWKKITSRING